MNADVLLYQINLTVPRLNDLLLKISEDVNIEEKEFKEVVVGILRSVALLRTPQWGMSQAAPYNETQKDIHACEETVKRKLIEPFISLTWSGKPFYKRVVFSLLTELLELDSSRWMWCWIPCIMSCLQSSHPTNILIGLRNGVRSLLEALKLYSSTLEKHDSLSNKARDCFITDVVEILNVSIDEIQIFLVGSRLIPEMNVSRDVISYTHGEPSLCVHGGSTISKEVQLKVVEAALSVLKKIILLPRRLDHLFAKSFDDIKLRCLMTFIETVLWGMKKESVLYYTVILETVTTLLLYRGSFEQCSGYLIPLLSFVCYCVSPRIKGWDEGSEPDFHLTRLTEISPLLMDVMQKSQFWRLGSLQKSFLDKGFSVFIHDETRQGSIRIVMALLLLKLLALGEVKSNAFLDLWIHQCFVLLTFDDSASKISLESLYERAHELRLLGLFDGLLIEDSLQLKSSSNTGEAHKVCSQQANYRVISLNDPTDSEIMAPSLQKNEVDVVSWLATVKSHEDVVDLIMSNFSRRSPELKGLSSLVRRSEKLREPKVVDRLKDIFVVEGGGQGVAGTQSLSWLQDAHSISDRIVTRADNESITASPSLRDLRLSDIKTAYEDCESIRDPLDVSIAKMSPRTLLESPSFDCLMIPTRLAFIREHQDVLKATYFQHIIHDDLSCLEPNGVNKASLNYIKEEGAMLRQMKMEFLLRLLVEHTVAREEQEKYVHVYLKDVWGTLDTKESASWEACITFSVEILYAEYAHSVMRYVKEGDMDAGAEDQSIRFLDKLESFAIVEQVLGFDIPQQCYCFSEGETNSVSQGSLKEVPDSHSRLSYSELFSIVLQYVLCIPWGKERLYCQDYATLHTCFDDASLRYVVRFFLDCPYIPLCGFHVLWEFALGDSRHRKIALAILSSWLKNTEKPTLNKRSAYRMLLKLCYCEQREVREDVLAFMNRKWVYNPTSCGHHDFLQHTTMFSDGIWDNIGATGIWLEYISTRLLRNVLDIDVSVGGGPLRLSLQNVSDLCDVALFRTLLEEYAVHMSVEEHLSSKDAQWTELNVKAPVESLQVFHDTWLRREVHDRLQCLRDPIEVNILGVVQQFSTLLSVLCCHHPKLLSKLMSAHAVSLKLGGGISKALYTQFLETLEWISVDDFPLLLSLMEDKEHRLIPAYAQLLTRLVDHLTRNVGEHTSSFLQHVVSKGLDIYAQTKSIHIVIPLLPCFPAKQAEMLFKECISSGNKEYMRMSITRLCTYNGNKEQYPQSMSFLSPDSILWSLCHFSEESLTTEGGIPLSYVTDAVDCCIDLAKGQSTLFPPPMFLTVLGQLVEGIGHQKTHLDLPPLFGHLIEHIILNLPPLRTVLINDMFPLLFKQKGPYDPQRAIYKNPYAWKGLCSAVSVLWNGTLDVASKDAMDYRKALQKILSQIPNESLEALKRETGIPFAP